MPRCCRASYRSATSTRTSSPSPIAGRLAANPDGPVIAAGSTGSMPATAVLMATIAKLAHGAVVLPGLDTDLDEASWQLIAGSEGVTPVAGHPQFTLQALLTRMELQ